MRDVSVLVPRLTVLPLVLMIGLLRPVPALAQSTPGSRVLVMPFAADVEPAAPGGGGAALWLGEAASILITEGLSSVGVGALTREERIATFDELNLPMT